MEKNHGGNYNSAWLMDFIWGNKYRLLLAGLAGAIIVYISTLFMTPKYQSAAVVYAAGVNTEKQLHLTQGNTLLLLQLLESTYLEDSIIKRFNLVTHYGIDTQSEGWRNRLSKTYDQHIGFERTIYKSVKIKVLDKDPEFAARLANGIVEVSNEVNSTIVKQYKSSYLKKAASELNRKKEYVDSLALELARYKKEQAEQVSLRLNTLLAEKELEIVNLRKQLKTIREEAGLHGLSQQLDGLQRQYINTKSEYLIESGKLEVYAKKEPVYDSIRIMTEARAAGLKKKANMLETEMNKHSRSNDEYNRLLNELALQIQLRDQLIIRIGNIQNTFEPGVVSIEMQKKDAVYHSELEQLNKLRNEYEEVRAAFNQNESASYQISKAMPDYNPAWPRKWLFTGAAFILSLMMAFGILLIIRKN